MTTQTDQEHTSLDEGSAATSAASVVIITGLSGSGKSTAMRALEDQGFFCIDNMPVPLLPKVLELATVQADGRAPQRYAFVVDTRERGFLDSAGAVIAQLRAEGIALQVFFLETSDDILIKRYKETRRRHPMDQGGTVREGIEREREALAELRRLADAIIDTTGHTVHTLKQLIEQRVAGGERVRLNITILSFGFKHGLPAECDLVFDVRFLPNPYFVEGMRQRTGLEEDVLDYVMSFAESTRFVELFMQLAEFTLPLYEREGKSYLTVGIGCTGGKHRSVAISQIISSRLRGRGWPVEVRHRDVTDGL